LGVAVALNIKANALANAGDEPKQKSYKNWAWIAYGVGGAALATSIVLYIIGRRNSDVKADRVALLPVWIDGGAALALEGRF
jgi:hypothetical protein